MRLRLNLLQRVLLVATAGLIATILAKQVEEDGWDHAPWLVGILVIGTLLLIATSPKLEHKATVTTGPAKNSNPTGSDEGKSVVQERFVKSFEEWSRYLGNALVDRAPSLTKSIRSDLLPHVELVGLKVAFATYLLVIAPRHAGALKGADAKALRETAGGYLAKGIFLDCREIDPGFTREKALKASVQEITKVENLVGAVLDACKADDAFPLDPLWKHVEKELPFGLKTAADREAFYGMKVREEIGRLLI